MPPPPVQAPPPPPPPPPPPSSHIPIPIDKIKPPPLPEPSKAVLRAAKRSASKSNALADIWASQEEMEYEQTVKGTSFAMEGTADQQPQPYLPRWKRNKTNAKSKDHNIADVNDPCCPNADGYGEYRNRDQIERQTKDVARLQKQQHEQENGNALDTSKRVHNIVKISFWLPFVCHTIPLDVPYCSFQQFA